MKKIINICLILIIIPILMGAKWSEKYPIVGKNFTCEYTADNIDSLETLTIEVNSDGIYARYPDNNLYKIETNSGRDNPHVYNNKFFYFSSFDTEYFLREYKENDGCMRNIYLVIDAAGEHITTNCPTSDCPKFKVKKDASNNGGNTGKLDGYEDSNYECYQPNATSCKTYHVKVSETRTVYVELGFYKPSSSNTYERYFVVSYLPGLDDGEQAKLNETMAVPYQNYVYEIINPDLIFSYSNGKYNYIAESDFDVTIDPNSSAHYYIINKKLDDSIYSNYISVGQNIGTYDPSVYGKDNNIEEDLEIKPITFCEENRVLKVFQILGYVIFGAKVVVPLILLILGTIDFAKAVISSSEKAPQEALKSFGLRIVAAIIVFLIPTFLEFLISLVNEASETFKEKNENCTNCLFNPFNPDECKASNVDYDNAD